MFFWDLILLTQPFATANSLNNKSRFNTQKSNQNTTMARTKGKKSKKCTDLDEETLKKIYTEKNYVQPEDTELETIEEAARETSNSSEIGEDNINDQHTSKHQKVWIFERARHIEVQFSFPHTKVVPSASNADFFIFRNVPRRFLAMVVLPSLVHGLVQDASQV